MNPAEIFILGWELITTVVMLAREWAGSVTTL